MACKEDCKQAILNKVFDELTERRYTFSKISNDTIQLNNKQDNIKTKIQTPEQAHAVAEELAARTKQSFYGHVIGTINQLSVYDPITVTFSVSDSYINHVYENLPDSKRESNEGLDQQERDFRNNNTGINTNGQILLFSPTLEEVDTSAFGKFINHKESILIGYRNKLNKIQAEKRKAGITTAELTKLKNEERELNLIIEGSYEQKKKGLVDEIAELKKGSGITSIKYYVEKDLQRLEKLVQSTDIDDLQEAQRIISFYTLAGDFKWTEEANVRNPFFTKDDIFLPDASGKLTSTIKLSQATIDQFKEWQNQATGFQNELDRRHEEVTTAMVNTDYSVQKTYGKNKQFSFDELTNKQKGLRDTDWISMWTMDITNGMFSNNGIIPQVMFSYLVNSFEKKLAWAREIERKIDEINPKVQEELKRLGYTLRGGGIIGLSGASYNLFKEISKEGNETNALVTRYTKEYADELDTALAAFRANFDSARAIADYATKQRKLNFAFESMKRWRRNNSIIVDITKVPEIASEAEFSEFGATADAAYKDSLVKLLGAKGYDEEINKQKELLRKFQATRQSFIDTLLIDEGKVAGDPLSADGQNKLDFWDNNHNPLKGHEDYYSVKGLFFGQRKSNSFMDFNHFIPRKYKANITANIATDNYDITDTTDETGHYNKNFAVIESNPTLSSFYDIVKEVSSKIKESIPYELQQKMAANTLPGLQKASSEMLADKNTGILSSLVLAFRHMMDRIRTNFGVAKQSEISYAVVDPSTGQTNYKVNDGFLQGNDKAISQRMLIEKTKFLQAFNSTLVNGRLDKIGKFSNISLGSMNTASLILLAQYTHTDISLSDIKNRNLKVLHDKVGDNVEIGRIIKDFSIHSVVQTQSFDLAKLSKYFSNMTMAYAARQEALPILEIMKKHYQKIQRPGVTNIDNPIYNVREGEHSKVGLRTQAIKQMDDWFERVALGNYGSNLHKGLLGAENKDGKIPFFGKNIYTTEERKKYNELQVLIDKAVKEGADPKEIQKLVDIQKGLGKTRTATAAIDNILSWVRTLKLGYNLSSATTNHLEGIISNVILAADGSYFDSKEIYYGYGVIKHSFIKNLSFGWMETGLAKKNRSLMDKFNVIMDSKNELQKSSHKTFSSKFSWLNPHELNQRVEYINQSPVMIAMLRTLKIKDTNGKESSVWDAYDKFGKLKQEFRTQDNITNWEELSGEDYLNFKQKLHKAIVIGHGNYDELRGMMIKSGTAGKAVAMFKTYLPQQIYWRFATEQDDLQAGTIGFKGRYWSYGRGSGALHGAAVGFASFGPVGAAIGGGLGYAFGAYNKSKGVDTGVGLLQESLESLRVLGLKMIGVPVNLATGRKLIGDGADGFQKWVKKGGKFTQQDANNLKGNMADIHAQLVFLLMIIAVKAMFWDDDDKPDDPERIAHNIAVNKLMQLTQQAASYTSLPDIYNNTIGTIAIVQFATDAGKEVDAIGKLMDGNDVIATGPNAGESRIHNQTNKLFMPGLFKDKYLGFESQSQRVYTESPVHKYFRSDETLDKTQNQGLRAQLRHELEESEQYQAITDEKERKKQIEAYIDKELPTTAHLKKLGLTREQYEMLKDQQEQGNQPQ